MNCALLMAFQVVETRHALQSQPLPVAGAGSHLTTTVLGKGLGLLSLEVPNRGVLSGAHLTLLWEKQQPEAPGQGTDRAYVTTQMVPNLA